MENNIHNNYLIRAIEAYPYELERAVEALNYALSFDPNSVKALCLMAKVQSEQFYDYELAKQYYEKALASRLDIPDVYPDYIRLLVNNEDYEKAQNLIDFARNVKGIDKAGIELAQGFLLESICEFDNAIKALHLAKQLAMNNEFISYVDETLSRINKKLKAVKNEERKNENIQKNAAGKTDNSWFRNQLNNIL